MQALRRDYGQAFSTRTLGHAEDIGGGDGCEYDQCGTVFAIKKP